MLGKSAIVRTAETAIFEELMEFQPQYRQEVVVRQHVALGDRFSGA
jgi:hypothetical protein